MQAKSENVIPS